MWLAWLPVPVLAVLCGVLAVLQYRWIGQVTEAERDRLHKELHSKLEDLRRAFNEELAVARNGTAEAGAQWFRRRAVAANSDGQLRLYGWDRQTQQYLPIDWPPEWSAVRASLIAGPMPMRDSSVLVLPEFGGPPDGRNGEQRTWQLLEFNLDYVRGTVIPRLMRRYLSSGGQPDYDAELVDGRLTWSGEGDDSVALGDLRPERGPGPPAAMDMPRRDAPPPPPDPGRGLWRLRVRRRAGSLEALVAQTRERNLAIAAGILLLIAATIATLARSTRRAQQLARQQMDFVAGVSHELRTPLTVIRTAGFNLRGKLAARPDQVARYGSLIQAESEKLQTLVERVLQFARIEAGHPVGAREPVAVDALLGDDLLFGSGAESGAHVERSIDPHLPRVLGDAVGLRQAIRNLVDNAVKYGADGAGWVGLQAHAVAGKQGPMVEICVADHGPGIPPHEQKHIFEPFFRGRNALRDQVHGTGLGLSLAKKIVEAHGGTIRVRSELLKGAEFIVQIPTVPQELLSEPANSIS